MTEASRVQKMLNEQNAEIDQLKYRIEKLQNALRYICGPSTVEYVEGTYEIDYVRMNWMYRKVAKDALEGNYD